MFEDQREVHELWIVTEGTGYRLSDGWELGVAGWLEPKRSRAASIERVWRPGYGNTVSMAGGKYIGIMKDRFVLYDIVPHGHMYHQGSDYPDMKVLLINPIRGIFLQRAQAWRFHNALIEGSATAVSFAEEIGVALRATGNYHPAFKFDCTFLEEFMKNLAIPIDMVKVPA